MTTTITINRAPVLTLWAAVVAEYLGFDEAEALTLGRALAGLTAHAKGVRLGLYEPTAPDAAERRQKLGEGEALEVALLGRAIPAVSTAEGLRATSRGKPIEPKGVERYLEGKLGQDLPRVRAAMRALAREVPPAELARIGFRLYERFRPEIPADVEGWGKEGILDLGRIAAARRHQAGAA